MNRLPVRSRPETGPRSLETERQWEGWGLLGLPLLQLEGLQGTEPPRAHPASQREHEGLHSASREVEAQSRRRSHLFWGQRSIQTWPRPSRLLTGPQECRAELPQ